MNISRKQLRDMEVALWAIIVSFAFAFACVGPAACDAQGAKTAADGVIRIAKDVCVEEADAGDPEWVSLACKVVSAVSGLAAADAKTVHIQIPRVAWAGIQESSNAVVKPQ